MKQPLLLLWLCLLTGLASAQQLTQTLRGTVTDANTLEPLIGAEIILVGSEPLLGTTSDENGRYVLEGVPVGRQVISCSYIGYQPYTRDNLQITSSKEYVLDIALKEGVELSEIVVNAYERNEAVNELFVASIRRIDPEALQYHAATANDPGRLVMSFPGVQPSRDSRSDIVIRGNSSAGILWRLEGIDIPNPNHFARRGSSGGGITIFSASLLGSSDFSVGAFPAEYGNAFSGVFDMRFRNGNMYQREHTFRAGLLGLDLATEGPIKEGKSSYLANFRYSTLGILNAAGLYLVGPRTDNNFQDFSFKIHHQGKKSQFSFWGIGGNSRELFRTNDMPWQTYSDYTAYRFTTQMGVLGANWKYLIDDKSYLQVNAGLMAQNITVQDDTLSPTLMPFAVNREEFITQQATVHSFYKRSFSPRVVLKLGAIGTAIGYRMMHERWNPETMQYRTILDAGSRPDQRPPGEEALPLQLQSYLQFSLRPFNRVLFNAGAHLLNTNLGEGRTALEPRLALKYDLSRRSSLSLSYGLHHRMPPLGNYFVYADGTYPNLGLDLIRASHTVLGFNQLLGKNLNLSVELYYQELSQVPVGIRSERIYWTLNDVQGFAEEALRSEGTGRNMGIDVFLEKFFDQGTFFILSTSVYSSTFQVPGDTRRFNTQYNSRFSLNFTGGKTWMLNSNTFLEGGFRTLFNAGTPLTPLAAGFENLDGPDPVLDGLRPFEDRTQVYIRPDLRLALRKNKEKTSYWLALDIQNLINRRNQDVIDYEFFLEQGGWGNRLQSGLTPLITFQLDF